MLLLIHVQKVVSKPHYKNDLKSLKNLNGNILSINCVYFMWKAIRNRITIGTFRSNWLPYRMLYKHTIVNFCFFQKWKKYLVCQNNVWSNMFLAWLPFPKRWLLVEYCEPSENFPRRFLSQISGFQQLSWELESSQLCALQMGVFGDSLLVGGEKVLTFVSLLPKIVMVIIGGILLFRFCQK